MAAIQVPEHLPETITLSPDVHIEFHQGHRGVHWATLHTAYTSTEIGSARTPSDIDNVLTMAAMVLMDRPASATRTFADKATGERWVLVGSWVLSARLGYDHADLGSPAAALSHFNRLVGSRL